MLIESIGCGDFREQNPKKTVLQLMSRVQLQALKRELRRRVEFKESLEKNVKTFNNVLVEEAVNCEVYGHNNADNGPKKAIAQRPSSTLGNEKDSD